MKALISALGRKSWCALFADTVLFLFALCLPSHAIVGATVFAQDSPPDAIFGQDGSPGVELPKDPENPPVPSEPSPNGDVNDSFLMLTPAPEYGIRGGYVMTGDNNGANHGGGVGVVLFMDGGRIGLQLQGQYAATSGGVFAYASGDLRVRYRIPINPSHILWGGVGLDVGGRGAGDPRINGFFSAQAPVAFVGYMNHFGKNRECVVHLFAKAAFSVFDSQIQGDGGKWARPVAGGEALAQCGTIRVMADYQHIFRLSETEGDTHKAALSVSQVWPIKGDGEIQLGYFLKGGYSRLGPVSGLDDGDSRSDARHIADIFGGLEIRFGTVSKPR